MKITIDQIEIETAIRNYVATMINVREGSEILISMAATRGAAGFTAEIEINTAGTVSAIRVEDSTTQTSASEQKQLTTTTSANLEKAKDPEVAKPAGLFKRTPKPTTTPPVEQTEPENQQIGEPEVGIDPGNPVGDAEAGPASEDETIVRDDEPAAPPPTTGRRLFGAKPTN